MRVSILSGALALASCLLVPQRAEACGGCFHLPNMAVSSVTGHRMAFAVSETRTVLWDQFQYSGAPEDFSWVLPVQPGAYIEESTDAWFESLDTVTQVRVAAPLLNCASAEDSGCGCGAMEASADMPRSSVDSGGDVTVVHKGTVGPYETVTLRSTDPDALSSWLGEHGYAIPPDIEPIIDAYVGEGYDFVALRLQPDAGVNQMTPVRVVTPGGQGRLPLRMVAAGVGESVDIILYVITENRSSMPDLHEVTVDQGDLVWDFAVGDSNYLELRRQALARNLGYSYLTAFADVQAFSKTYNDATGSPLWFTAASDSANYGTYETFSGLYFGQARANDGAPPTWPKCPNIDGLLQSPELVHEDPASGELGASSFVCDDYTDIAAAMIGMHPASVWTSRLELKLPKEALSMDCVVEPADTQEPASQMLLASQKKNVPCAESTFESRISPHRPVRAVSFGALLAALLFLRRRARRTGRT